MKWLRISNPGSFDIVKSVSMLGASVKENDDPIGLFGSGVKFSLAQAMRSDIQVKITTGNEIYTVCSEMDSFRNKEFSVVNLKTKSGKKIKTPMTTRFGAEDWTEDWFIFREFYSNAIDEGNHSIDIVDGIQPITDATCVFLPYANFKEIHDNLETYFTSKKEGIFSGHGEVYKKRVFVGRLAGTNLCIHDNDIKINECRVMDETSAITQLGIQMAYCDDSKLWADFFNSKESFLSKMSVYIGIYSSDSVLSAINDGLVDVYGEKYCICPNVDDIIRDLTSMGYVPVVIQGLNLQTKSTIIKTFTNIDNSQSVRDMTTTEQNEFDKIRKSISAFIPDYCTPSIKVISEGAAEILGQADMVNRIVYLRGTLFGMRDNTQLVSTIIHEFGHIITKRGDYDRTFTDFFVKALTDMSK